MNKVYRSIAIAVITGISSLSAQTTPTPWNLNSAGNYSFTSFSQTATSFPASMAIHQMNTSPVTLSSTPVSDIPLPCPQTAAPNTNVWGLDAQGIGIRSNPAIASTGYQKGKLGEVVVAVNTTSRTNVQVSFKAGTYAQGTGQSAVFKLRCQYRVGSSGAWLELPGGPVEYQTILAIDSVNMGPYALPSSVDNQAVVQVRWVYYYISGAWTVTNNRTHRARLDDISITSLPIVTQSAFATVCPTSSKITLSGGSPAGGTYTGAGVTNGNQFDPATAGVGTFPITYSYTDAFGMSNSVIQNITVDYSGCVTQLDSNSCGITETGMDQVLHSNVINGATNYKYQITDNTNGTVYSYVRGSSINDLQLSWLKQLCYNRSYDVRVAVYINGAWQPFGSGCTVTIPVSPLTQLSTTLSSITVSSLNQVLYCNTVPGVSNYRYEITNVSNGNILTYTRGTYVNNLMLAWVSGIQYNTTYSIRVASQAGGVWSPYGTAVNVTTPGCPLTQLSSSSCGITETRLDGMLYSTAVPAATDYRYEITDVSNGNIYTYTRGSNHNNLQLAWVAGVQYNKTYAIRVAVESGGAWSSYGTACSVTTPTPPVTQLAAGSCGATVPTLTTTLYADNVPGAGSYLYEITDLSSNTVTTYLRPTSLNNLQLAWVNGISVGKIYSIRVASQAGGVWFAYGPACTVSTVGAARVADIATIGASEGESAERIIGEINQTAAVYPNPNQGKFHLEITVASDVRVTNLLGVNVYSNHLSEGKHALDLSSVEPGVYLVQIYDGKDLRVIRMIKE